MPVQDLERGGVTVETTPSVRDAYLDLVEKSLLNQIYEDPWIFWTERGKPKPFDVEKRRLGRDWPVKAHTMIGQLRMRNLRNLVEDVLERGIPGDLIETGVWRGGACIYMRAILKAHGVTDRRVFVADSFEGLPPPDPARYPADRGDPHHQFTELAVSLEEVKDNFTRYDLLDEQVVFLKGWFKDTLPVAPVERIAVLRLDGDMYESTMDSLTHLYPKLSPGGYVIIDDYGCIPQCKKAVIDYCNDHEIGAKVVDIDSFGVYWQKPYVTDLKPLVNISHMTDDARAGDHTELVDLLSDAFHRMRLDTVATRFKLFQDRLNVLVGHTAALPADSIERIAGSGAAYVVVQTEPLDELQGPLSQRPKYLDLLKRAKAVWDPDPTHAAFYARHGMTHATTVPLGLSRVLQRVPPRPVREKDIDVLHSGPMTERNVEILHALKAAGHKVLALPDARGLIRDEAVSRARIVLEMRPYGLPHLDLVRLQYLLNNAACVVAESGDHDPFAGALTLVPRGELVLRCRELLAPGSDLERERLARRGREALAALPMLEALKKAIQKVS